jgi:hypothetical protein
MRWAWARIWISRRLHDLHGLQGYRAHPPHPTQATEEVMASKDELLRRAADAAANGTAATKKEKSYV